MVGPLSGYQETQKHRWSDAPYVNTISNTINYTLKRYVYNIVAPDISVPTGIVSVAM